MSFQIEWPQPTLARFAAEIDLLDFAEQRDVFSSLDEVDRQLTNDPMSVGESRDDDTIRVHFEGRVSIVFYIDLRLRLVRIVRARLVSRP